MEDIRNLSIRQQKNYRKTDNISLDGHYRICDKVDMRKIQSLPEYVVAELEVAFENLFHAKLDKAEGRMKGNHVIAKFDEKLANIARRAELDHLDEPQRDPDYPEKVE